MDLISRLLHAQILCTNHTITSTGNASSDDDEEEGDPDGSFN